MSKIGTARVVAWNDIGIPASYTLEISLCGTGNNKEQSKHSTSNVFSVNDPLKVYRHYCERDLEAIGKQIGKAVLHYTNLCDHDTKLKIAWGQPSPMYLPDQASHRSKMIELDVQENEPIIVPCVLSRESAERLSNRSLRARSERVLTNLISSSQDIACHASDIDSSDELLLDGLVSELRADEAVSI